MPTTETIDKLYLELAYVTQVKTERELELEAEVLELEAEVQRLTVLLAEQPEDPEEPQEGEPMPVPTISDVAGLAELQPGQGAIVAPGVYAVDSNLTIRGHLWFLPGAVLKPSSGMTISWSSGASITAGDYQIFDDSGGGAFQGTASVGWARSSWFPGGASRDLGVQLNNAFGWGFLQVDVPPAPDHTIKTTVRLRHGSTIRCLWHGYPRHVRCATNDKPVFEAIGGVRHWRVIGGVFDGQSTDTPSCFLLCAREDVVHGQCGDTTALSETQVTGHWGIGNIVDIAAEVLVFSNCNLWIQGRGDSTWTGPRATVVIGNADYWGVPYAYTKPNAQMASTSAIVFQNCDIRGGTDGSVFLLKGQVEDVTIVPSYMNCQGRAHIVVEPGNIGTTWSCPRRLKLMGGGRTENNGGAASGTPVVLVDGLDRSGMGIYHLSIEDIGLFVGSTANSTPAIKTERLGLIHALKLSGVHLESSSRLIEHKTADLNWADIHSTFNASIDCTGKAINESMIKTNGQVLGTVGSKTKVQSANSNNW